MGFIISLARFIIPMPSGVSDHLAQLVSLWAKLCQPVAGTFSPLSPVSNRYNIANFSFKDVKIVKKILHC